MKPIDYTRHYEHRSDRRGVQFLKQFEPASETSEDDTEQEGDPDELPSFDDDDSSEDWVVSVSRFWFLWTGVNLTGDFVQFTFPAQGQLKGSFEILNAFIIDWPTPPPTPVTNTLI